MPTSEPLRKWIPQRDRNGDRNFTGPLKPPPKVARQAFALERKQALNTVVQLKLDLDSYNVSIT